MRVDKMWFLEHNMLHRIEFFEVYNPNTNPK
jgi:hypothetical protein